MGKLFGKRGVYHLNHDNPAFTRPEFTNTLEQRPISMTSIRRNRKRDTGNTRGPVHTDSTGDEVKGSAEFEKCVECIKAVPVISHDEIDVGDHITFSRRMYDHHGIVTEKLGTKKIKIIEATKARAGAGSSFWGKAFIEENLKTLDFVNDRINVVVYQNRVFTKAEVARRAKAYYLKQTETRDFNYNIFKNNCEHFATRCVTDKAFSIQVVKVRMVDFDGISDERMRNEKLFEMKYICGRCYEINKRLLCVSITPIKLVDDVKAGDVIRYLYYKLPHDAVVLETKGACKTSVRLTIVHYADFGFRRFRTIIEETITIRFDGSCRVLQYGPPQYEVFPPEKVVERAKSRIGEKCFVSFSNNSSHFSRWCKLPRKRRQSETDTPDDHSIINSDHL
ncbi:uncharacterized protein LOC128213705 isoform X1 [Mya arenaria]|uniref:uncharacterized protein LOC128213705 isoform X1 n=1 Tax=Mya arenaria TaxID=6604 RepID=UPI0022E14D84|nr:uncharacterized protein LOC128213705 isoform X1 [Mya arenaria]XP_052775678.1 uncharacterized protein LOC128213705 isoform X1 [Mya arenaria]XP_052775679.1 uncharacterized protein LOC128213705 isoform X1 [Mya arenaria]XP_052775680.1 uncharacterized protein LOC128213705 isoform X1 [Mya arenaria]